MNKEEYRAELEKYSKGEIIDAIVNTDDILANRIVSKLYQNRNNDLRQATDEELAPYYKSCYQKKS